jgi:hypothetical protein
MFHATFLIIASVIGQSQNAKVDARLEFMKSEAASYRISKRGDRATPLTFREEPAFRLGKQPADDVEEGAIFLWLGEDGRPEASLQLFLVKNAGAPKGVWAHEFNSLSAGSLAGTRRERPSWSPASSGVDYHRLDDGDVPKPAGARAFRARQMRAIAQSFRVTDYFKDKSWTELRLLPTPIARYGSEGAAVIDGALFAFVTGTDPEACVFVEARQGKNGPEWFYALGPFTCYSLKAEYKNKEVWDLPRRRPNGNPNEAYYITIEPLKPSS